MYAYDTATVSPRTRRAAAPGVLSAIGTEIAAFVHTIVNAREVIAEVERMRALQVRADRIEARDPARAAALRARASLIGLN